MDRKDSNAFIVFGIIVLIVVGAAVTLVIFFHGKDQAASHSSAVNLLVRDLPEQDVQPQIAVPSTAPSNIRIETGFECSVGLTFQAISDTHVIVTLEDPVNSRDWWMFRMTGVAGKKVQVDLKVPREMTKWTTLNPVYSDVADLDDPAAYEASASTDSTITAQGVTLPSTDGQKWHYIADAFVSGKEEDTFVFTQEFSSDRVWIANRVPCPPEYNEKFIRALAGNPLAKLTDIGTTPDGHHLRMVQIDPGDDEAARNKPCVLICGGEQADQADGIWSAQGAISYLLGDTENAKELRKQCRFLVIPELDPDGTAKSNEAMAGQFQPRRATPVTIAYANFFQKWIMSGNRLDAVLELHSLESNESPHVICAVLDGDDTRGPIAESFNEMLLEKFSEAKFNASHSVWYRSPMPTRFGGWLSANYGAFYFAFFVNAQDPSRHLDLAELKDTGRLFAQAAGDFFNDAYGAQLLKAVDDARAHRQERWNGCAATMPSQNALESEAAATAHPEPQ